MAEAIKFYLDEHVAKAVAAGLRRRGVDVLTAHGATLRAQPDEVHLNRAAREGRVLFTQDRDFLKIHAAGTSHAGIVYAEQHRTVGELIRGLLLIHAVLSAEEMVGQVEFL